MVVSFSRVKFKFFTKSLKINHENTKFKKHEIFIFWSFFVFSFFRAFVLKKSKRRNHE